VETEKAKPILICPPLALRKRIEAEAKKQSRSMNNLLIIILTKAFKTEPSQDR